MSIVFDPTRIIDIRNKLEIKLGSDLIKIKNLLFIYGDKYYTFNNDYLIFINFKINNVYYNTFNLCKERQISYDNDYIYYELMNKIRLYNYIDKGIGDNCLIINYDYPIISKYNVTNHTIFYYFHYYIYYCCYNEYLKYIKSKKKEYFIKYKKIAFSSKILEYKYFNCFSKRKILNYVIQ